MNIGYWLCQTKKNDIRQFWIEAYACALQRVAEASIGRRWIAFEGIRVPKILRVVEVFLHATGTCVPPERIHQCWPAQHTETPMQSLDGIRRDIVCKLDEVATRCLSPIAWDPFAFPLTDDTCWREEVLCYRLGKTLDVGACMPGFKLILRLRSYLRRVHVSIQPSTRHCAVGATMRHIRNSDNARVACGQ